MGLFETRYLLRGTFKGNGFEILNCNCEFIANNLDTSNLTANIYASPSDVPISFMNLPVDHWNNVEFIDENKNCHLQARIKVHRHSDDFGIIAELEKPNFTLYTTLNNNDYTAKKLTINFTLTECNLFQIGYRGKVDIEKGYQRGVDNWSDEQEKETISLEFPWGIVKFYRNIMIRGEDDKLTIKTLAEPACISFTYFTKQKKKINFLWDDVEKLVNKFIVLLSYLDQQPIYWVKADGAIFDDDLKILLIEQYQSIEKINHSNIGKFEWSNARKIRDTYCQLLPFFLTIPESDSKALTNSIQRYLLAVNAESPIEVRIMLLQSAIEVLAKHYNQEIIKIIKTWNFKGKYTASMKVLALSQQFGIDFSRYYEQSLLDSVKSGESIPFIELRNKLTHEGISSKTEKIQDKEFVIMNNFFRILVYNILVKRGHELEGFKIL